MVCLVLVVEQQKTKNNQYVPETSEGVSEGGESSDASPKSASRRKVEESQTVHWWELV